MLYTNIAIFIVHNYYVRTYAPKITLKNETFAWQWEQKEKEFRMVIIKGEIYFVPVGEKLKSTDKECLDYYEKQNSLPFKSFDAEINKFKMIRFIKDNWKKSQCTC